ELERFGALAMYVPLEGGYEGRYQRRLRAAGYTVLNLTARGLGDLSAYLQGVHGVRPPHLGKKTIGNEAAVGYRYFVPPILTYNLENMPAQNQKGLVLWLIEGFVLSSQEIDYLSKLPSLEPRIKVVVELGGGRVVQWQPLKADLVISAS
ncbi:MAG: NAD(P)H-quinone oxidoreductase subunit N, partial [Cyanobacteria bacterium]|nr:NAD(P)H-quinone oxidoreductase subunit N [Cyanobacteriota bacterium]MDW8201711.1 NAD(P)H-quinone oxidoreductase subunit N [Cyanobacteriota bacterium SKYGB_h_bin112]